MQRLLSTLLLLILATILAGPALAQQKGKLKEPDEEEFVPPEKLGKLTVTLDPGGHTASITRMFFTPDGQQLITLGMDHAIHFWEVKSGRRLKVLHPPGVGGLRAAALSVDGKRLAVGSSYPHGTGNRSVIYFLALPEGRVERHLVLPNDRPIESIALSANGKRLAVGSAGAEFTIRVWDLERDGNEPAHVLRKKKTRDIALSPDGSRLACVDKIGEIIDLNNGKKLAEIQGTRVVWSPDGQIVTTAGNQTGVQFWNSDGQRLAQHLQVKNVQWLTCRQDSQAVLVGGIGPGGRCRAFLVEVATGKIQELHPKGTLHPKGIPYSAGRVGAIAPDGQLAAIGGGTGGLGLKAPAAFLWRLQDGRIQQHLQGQGWLEKKRVEAAWSADSMSITWDSQFTEPSFHLGELHLASPLARAISQKPDGLSLERGTRPGMVNVLKDGKLLRQLDLGAKLTDMTLVGKDRVALVGRDWGQVGRLQLVEIATGKLLRRFAPTWASSIAPSPDGRFLLTASLTEQKLRIYSLDREQPLLSLFVAGQDWIIWTPEGYYAATPGGERLLGWTVDHGIDHMPSYYPVQRFRKQLHRPDLIKKVFELGSLEAALKALDGAKAQPANPEHLLPPKCSLKIIKDNGQQVTVQVIAAAQVKGQPVVALRLLLDGHPFPDLEVKEFTPAQAKAEASWTVAVPAGFHQLGALVRSQDASALAEPLSVQRGIAVQPPVLHLLAIGINQYKNGIPNLTCAVNDARDLSKAFPLVQQGNLFRAVKPHLLTNQQATARDIRDQLAKLRLEVAREDVLVLFFAGHGVREEKDFYLLTADSNLAQLEKTALSGRELIQLLPTRKCQVVVLLDACHAAAVIPRRPATDDAARTLADDEVGITVLAAARGHEKAIEKDGNGFFTAAIKEALAGGMGVPRNPHDGRMYLHHLHSYVLDTVALRSKQRQHPFLSEPSTALPLAVRQLAK